MPRSSSRQNSITKAVTQDPPQSQWVMITEGNALFKCSVSVRPSLNRAISKAVITYAVSTFGFMAFIAIVVDLVLLRYH